MKNDIFSTVLMSFAALVVTETGQAQWAEPEDGELIIRGGWLFDAVAESRRPNTGIVIRSGVIAEVDAELEQQIPGTASVIDLHDSDTILPGLIDLHAH